MLFSIPIVRRRFFVWPKRRLQDVSNMGEGRRGSRRLSIFLHICACFWKLAIISLIERIFKRLEPICLALHEKLTLGFVGTEMRGFNCWVYEEWKIPPENNRSLRFGGWKNIRESRICREVRCAPRGSRKAPVTVAWIFRAGNKWI